MQSRKFFPLGKAYGLAFCNRVEETKWLVNNLQSVKHSLLIAPRRYGKSSLAEKAIAASQLPAVNINFHLCTTEAEVAEIITAGVSKLISQTAGPLEKIANSIKQYTANLNHKLVFANNLVTIELTPQQSTNSAIPITESLLLLEKLLHEKNQQAVIFFDEFQEISKIKKSSNLEGAIRTAAQELQHLSLIFSGSIRSLLLDMFDDESRPLYKLCRKLKLERISANDYEPHINKIALETWHKKLEETTFATIMQLSNRHPYYVNYLCDILWGDNDQLPGESEVKKAWGIVIEEERSDIIREIESLSLAQRKVLKFIATQTTGNLLSHAESIKISLPSSTVSSAIKVLLEEDYIEFDATVKRYSILNPLIAAVFSERQS